MRSRLRNTSTGTAANNVGNVTWKKNHLRGFLKILNHHIQSHDMIWKPLRYSIIALKLNQMCHSAFSEDDIRKEMKFMRNIFKNFDKNTPGVLQLKSILSSADLALFVRVFGHMRRRASSHTASMRASSMRASAIDPSKNPPLHPPPTVDDKSEKIKEATSKIFRSHLVSLSFALDHLCESSFLDNVLVTPEDKLPYLISVFQAM